MASSNWSAVRSPLTSAVGEQSLLPIRRSAMVATKSKIKTASVSLQVKCEKGHKSSETRSSISRRDMMQCLSAEALGLVLLPKPAEARVSRLEMKKKIMEKLEELKEKAGLSKPKAENGTKSPKEPSPNDKNSPTLPLPLPTVKPLVEATLP